MTYKKHLRPLLRAVLRFALRATLACVQNVPYILVRLRVFALDFLIDPVLDALCF